MKANLALTGANGFLGKFLFQDLHSKYNIYPISLKNTQEVNDFLENINNNKYQLIINYSTTLTICFKR